MRVRRDIVFLNGKFVPAADARVSAFDRGLLYGDGLFETIRTYSGHPFALEGHLARLRRAARHVRLPLPQSDAWWRARIVELIERNRLAKRDAAVRLTVTRGVGGDGLIPPVRPRPTVLIMARELPANLARLQRRGVGVALLPFHPGLGGYLSSVKTTDYLTAALGKALARRNGAFEGIYMTRAGRLLEGTTSNVFVIRGRSLETPPLGGDVLPGVTRGIILALARADGFRVRERPITRKDLQAADEAFLTATTIEIIPIHRVDGRKIGSGRRFTMVSRLQELFRTYQKGAQNGRSH